MLRLDDGNVLYTALFDQLLPVQRPIPSTPLPTTPRVQILRAWIPCLEKHLHSENHPWTWRDTVTIRYSGPRLLPTTYHRPRPLFPITLRVIPLSTYPETPPSPGEPFLETPPSRTMPGTNLCLGIRAAPKRHVSVERREVSQHLTLVTLGNWGKFPHAAPPVCEDNKGYHVYA